MSKTTKAGRRLSFWRHVNQTNGPWARTCWRVWWRYYREGKITRAFLLDAFAFDALHPAKDA